MTTPEAQTGDVLSFGRFRLDGRARVLTKNGVPVDLGARTLDLLIALASRPNERIGKRELLALIWPDVIVTEGSLRFHIASLRKALGDGEGGTRYITTLSGHGYCFVAAIASLKREDLGNFVFAPTVPGKTLSQLPLASIPCQLARMLGRADAVLALSSLLAESRFVTIVGTGGVGKTTIAVAVGHELADAFAGIVLFVDLGALRDPGLVAVSVASILGLSVHTGDPTSVLLAYLRDKRILLIFDTCEHLMEATAALTERIFASAAQVHILATSREALRVEGEHVYRLEPLAFPSDDLEPTTIASALTFPAIQLFMERAAATGARLTLGDAGAATVARICRKLDGVPLAIELAAGRVGAYGLEQTAVLLERRLSLLWVGHRTAAPRQQTLRATLEWSYELLSDPDRQVLRHLAIFIGSFTLEAAQGVLACTTLDHFRVLGAIDSLVAKSMVVADGSGTPMRYRLLDTTRAYALEIAIDAVERTDLAGRHAEYYRRRLVHIAAEWPVLSNAAQRALHLADLANVRAGLEWSLGPSGDNRTGVRLAAAALPVFWTCTFWFWGPEKHLWAERALLALDETTRGGVEEMQLQATLGMSYMFRRGEPEPGRAAFNRGLAIAEARGDVSNHLKMLVPLHASYTRTEDCKNALTHAKRGVTAARAIGDPVALAVARTLLGITLHFIGDLGAARMELEAGLQRQLDSARNSAILLGAGYQLWAGAALSRTLWMQGNPAQAMEYVRRTVAESESMDIRLGLILDWTFSVILWTGDVQGAKKHLDAMIARTESISIGRVHDLGFRGQLAICCGEFQRGVDSLQRCIEGLRHAHYELLPEFNISLVQGLAALGRVADGMTLIDEAIGSVQVNGDLAHLPELLRAKGGLLLSMPQTGSDAAESCFMQSLDLSRSQGALAWELRAAMDLARLWAARGRSEQAQALLESVLERFSEGFETVDLMAAARLLTTLRR
jgi:predicted ATPase/DNA-binding winged helix-turn-helix (wHTH) protein